MILEIPNHAIRRGTAAGFNVSPTKRGSVFLHDDHKRESKDSPFSFKKKQIKTEINIESANYEQLKPIKEKMDHSKKNHIIINKKDKEHLMPTKLPNGLLRKLSRADNSISLSPSRGVVRASPTFKSSKVITKGSLSNLNEPVGLISPGSVKNQLRTEFIFSAEERNMEAKKSVSSVEEKIIGKQKELILMSEENMKKTNTFKMLEKRNASMGKVDLPSLARGKISKNTEIHTVYTLKGPIKLSRKMNMNKKQKALNTFGDYDIELIRLHSNKSSNQNTPYGFLSERNQQGTKPKMHIIENNHVNRRLEIESFRINNSPYKQLSGTSEQFRKIHATSHRKLIANIKPSMIDTKDKINSRTLTTKDIITTTAASFSHNSRICLTDY